MKENGRRGKRVFIALALLALVLAVKFGGGLLLSQFGLGWRNRIDGPLSLAAAALFGWLMANLIPWVNDSGLFPNWVKWPFVILASLGTVWLLIGCLYLFCLFGSFTDRVSEYQGRKVVVEITGIFQETGYRYVNPFVHGEEVYVWRD